MNSRGARCLPSTTPPRQGQGIPEALSEQNVLDYEVTVSYNSPEMRGDTLKRLRERKGLTQTELASRVGVTAAYISMLESGAKGNPTLGIVRRLTKALGVSVTELITLLETGTGRTR